MCTGVPRHELAQQVMQESTFLMTGCDSVLSLMDPPQGSTGSNVPLNGVTPFIAAFIAIKELIEMVQKVLCSDCFSCD